MKTKGRKAHELKRHKNTAESQGGDDDVCVDETGPKLHDSDSGRYTTSGCKPCILQRNHLSGNIDGIDPKIDVEKELEEILGPNSTSRGGKKRHRDNNDDPFMAKVK